MNYPTGGLVSKWTQEGRRIKLPLVTVLLAAFTFMAAITIGASIIYLRQNLDEKLLQITESIEKTISIHFENKTDAMGYALASISKNNEILEAFKARDRRTLLKLTEPLYRQLKREYQVTHFYFTLPTRENFLRVHQPDRHGDIIDRISTLEAERTGKITSGIEWGPLGTNTLRAVIPWRDGDRLVGYIELGRETNQLAEELKRAYGVDLLWLVQKNSVNREAWDKHRAKSKIETEWDQFTNNVVMGTTFNQIPDELVANEDLLISDDTHVKTRIEIKGKPFLIGVQPLKNLKHIAAGHLAVILDISDTENTFWITLLSLAGSIFLVIFSVAFFYYWVLGGVENEVVSARDYLEENIKERTKKLSQINEYLENEIQERKQAEEISVAARKEAEKANNAKSEFLSSMSHELRTPLNAVLGFTQLLNTDQKHPLTPDQISATEQILQSGDHLLNLIDEVLDLATIEAGKASLEIETQDPAPVIESCAILARNLAEQKGLAFYDRTTGWNLPDINIDETRFRQVLLNLLSNAVKYNKDGGTVTLAVEEGEESVFRISIADSGLGIAAEKHDQIFSPFSRLGLENSDITGTGIGLTITKELVEAMSGTIDFESTLNLGSTFWLEFPIVSGELTVKDPNGQSADTIPTGQTKHTVLCVEDNPSSLKLLETIIGRIQGTAMISAHTGELGVDLAEIHRPDVIMMDLNLPGMDGIETLKRLKASSVTRDIPVIALTARASGSAKKQGHDAGFEHYLTKPINVEEVTNTIQGFLSP